MNVNQTDSTLFSSRVTDTWQDNDPLRSRVTSKFQTEDIFFLVQLPSFCFYVVFAEIHW